jgi:hypothetical protein
MMEMDCSTEDGETMRLAQFRKDDGNGQLNVYGMVTSA